MLKYKHLEGFEFNEDNRHCYTLVRDFYRDNYAIELPDIACPTHWWKHGLDLYSHLALNYGFEIIHSNPRDWLPGDIVVAAIESPVGNHLMILLTQGTVLHHLYGQRSTATSYGGMFRNNAVAVYRHKDVPRTFSEQTVDLADLDLPPHIRRRLAAARALSARDAG